MKKYKCLRCDKTWEYNHKSRNLTLIPEVGPYADSQITITEPLDVIEPIYYCPHCVYDKVEEINVPDATFA